jgi:ATP-binding cassette subfamily G (WHITE) protein 1
MERLVFLREVNNNMYSVTTYFFSKIITEMPANIIFPLLQTVILYWSIGLNNLFWYKWLIFWAT